MTDAGPWVTASDVAEYAFCPRSHWYRTHPPAGGTTPEAGARAAAGVRYHDRVLGAERRRAERGGAYWAALVVGVALMAGGALWVYHP
jgi:hypothetical protein